MPTTVQKINTTSNEPFEWLRLNNYHAHLLFVFQNLPFQNRYLRNNEKDHHLVETNLSIVRDTSVKEEDPLKIRLKQNTHVPGANDMNQKLFSLFIDKSAELILLTIVRTSFHQPFRIRIFFRRETALKIFPWGFRFSWIRFTT